MLNFNLKRRLPPSTSILPNPTMHTGEHVLPKFTTAVQESFGPDFNIIRAIQEYGPVRVNAINKELLSIEDRKQRLTEEMNILTKLIAATE